MGMLVLSRKAGEKIIIGADIMVMVTEIRGDKVRLGVDAPRDVQVDRPEVRKSKETAPVGLQAEIDRLKQASKAMQRLYAEAEAIKRSIKLCPNVESTDAVCHMTGAMNTIDDARDELLALAAKMTEQVEA